MMDLLSQWLLRVVATTLLIAVAEVMMPQGAVKQVGKLTCGMLLMLQIVQPILSLSPDLWASFSIPFEESVETSKTEMEDYYNAQIKTIIEHDLAAYILDKAKEAEIVSHADVPNYVTVDCVLEDGIYLPHAVWIVGIDSEDEAFFYSLIGKEFGVEMIYFQEVEP